jgi:hypothetical protein
VKAFPTFQRQGPENDKARLIEASLRRYSRARAEVEAQIEKFLAA